APVLDIFPALPCCDRCRLLAPDTWNGNYLFSSHSNNDCICRYFSRAYNPGSGRSATALSQKISLANKLATVYSGNYKWSYTGCCACCCARIYSCAFARTWTDYESATLCRPTECSELSESWSV